MPAQVDFSKKGAVETYDGQEASQLTSGDLVYPGVSADRFKD